MPNNNKTIILAEMAPHITASLLVGDEVVDATRSGVLQRSRYRKGSNCQSGRSGKKDRSCCFALNHSFISHDDSSLKQTFCLRGLGRAWVEYRRVFASSAQNSYMEASTWQKKEKSLLRVYESSNFFGT